MDQNNRPENHPADGRTPLAAGRSPKLRWVAISVVIAALSVWAVASQWKNFSLRAFLAYVSQVDARWLAASGLAMLGFVGFEACAIRSACRALHYNVPLRSHCGYAAADIFFSAITPSATGGQPACALLMMHDGIPGIVTTAALLLTLAMYTLSILTLGVLCALLKPSVFMVFGLPSRILIAFGFVAQLALAAFFLLLIRTERLLKGICRRAIRLLARLRIVRDEAGRQAKLEAIMEEYRQCVSLLSGHRAMLLRAFLFNLLQRASQIAVTMLVFVAMGGQLRLAPDIFAMQCFVVLGSNSVPIPGAMGVADFLMLDGFSAFFQREQAIGIELLSRSVSFYSCVLICGLAVLLITYRTRKAFRR